MIKATLKDGFAVELDENAVDYVTADLLAKAMKDGLCFFEAVDHFLGEENKEKLLAHLADEKGRVPQEAMAEAVGELLNSFHDGKNSASSPN